MEQVSLTEAQSSLTDLVNQVSYLGKRISITRHGKPAAVLVSVEEAEFLERMEDQIDIREADKAALEKGRMSSVDLKRKLGL